MAPHAAPPGSTSVVARIFRFLKAQFSSGAPPAPASSVLSATPPLPVGRGPTSAAAAASTAPPAVPRSPADAFAAGVIDDLRRRGLDFRFAESPPASLLELATYVGDRFGLLCGYLKCFRYHVSGGARQIVFGVGRADPAQDAEEATRRARLLDAVRRIAAAGAYAVPPDTSRQAIFRRVWRHEPARNATTALLMGDWLAHYVRGVVDDQFARLGVMCASRSHVTTELPADVVAGIGISRPRYTVEFDVLAVRRSSTGGARLLIIECKSGSSAWTRPEQVVDMKRSLELALRSCGAAVEGIDVLCVQLDLDERPPEHVDAMRGRFLAEGIACIPLRELRKTLIAAVTDASPRVAGAGRRPA